MADAVVTVKLKVTDDATDDIKKFAKTSENSFTSMSQSMIKGLGKATLVVMGVRSAVETLQRAVELVKDSIWGGMMAASQFSYDLAQIGIVSQMSASQMNTLNEAGMSLSEVMREASRTTGISLDEISKGFYELGAVGQYSRTQMESMMKALIPLSIATGADLVDSVTLAARVMNAFNIQAGDAMDVANTLTYAANQSALSIYDFGTAMQYVASNASSMGTSLAETSVMLATLSNAGFTASIAGTSLNAAMSSLINPIGDGEKWLRRLGIQVADSEGNMKSMLDVIDELIYATEDFNETQKLQILSQLFGIRSGRAVLALMNYQEEAMANNTKTLQELTVEYENFNGVMEQSEIVLQTPQKQFESLLATAKDLAMTLGSEIVNSMTEMSAIDMYDPSQGMTSPLMAFTDGIEGLRPLLKELGAELGNAFKGVLPSIISLTGAFKPVLKAITSIVKALQPAIEGMTKGIAPAFVKFGIVLDKIMPSLEPLIEEFSTALIPIFEMMAESAMATGDVLIEMIPIFEAITPVVRLLGDVISGSLVFMMIPAKIAAQGLAAALNMLAPVIEFLVPFINAFAKPLSAIIQGLEFIAIGTGRVTKGFTEFGESMSIIEDFLGWLRALQYFAGQAVGGIIALKDAIVQGIRELVKMIQLADPVIGMLKGIGDVAAAANDALSPHGAVCLREAISNVNDELEMLHYNAANAGSALEMEFTPAVERGYEGATGGTIRGGGVGTRTGSTYNTEIYIEGSIRSDEDIDRINTTIRGISL